MLAATSDLSGDGPTARLPAAHEPHLLDGAVIPRALLDAPPPPPLEDGETAQAVRPPAEADADTVRPAPCPDTLELRREPAGEAPAADPAEPEAPLLELLAAPSAQAEATLQVRTSGLRAVAAPPPSVAFYEEETVVPSSPWRPGALDDTVQGSLLPQLATLPEDADLIAASGLRYATEQLPPDEILFERALGRQRRQLAALVALAGAGVVLGVAAALLL